jgi:hypothetical protein
MSRLLPALALTAAARRGEQSVLVGARRGAVLHLVVTDCQSRCALTATGRLRRGQHVLCGQRARVWRHAPEPSRPLCAYCHAAVAPCSRATDWRSLTADDVVWALRHSRTAADVDVARRALVEAGLTNEPVWLHDGSYAGRLVDLLGRHRRLHQPTPASPGDRAWAERLPLDGTTPRRLRAA